MESRFPVTENRWVLFGSSLGITIALLAFWPFLIVFLLAEALLGLLEIWIFGRCDIIAIYSVQFLSVFCIFFFGWSRHRR